MCGIAGYLGPRPSNAGDLNNAIAAAIRYRGRDGEGFKEETDVVRLFHARLSIIDISGGGQPMTEKTGRYTIVYNGEVYNYLELRKTYEQAGYKFATDSDTEVILAGFALKGEKVCADLNGMFAFAIWDSQERVLFLARDRLGKKPLFWCNIADNFYFSSSLDAFSQIRGWTGEINSLHLGWYSTVSAVPTGTTIFKQAFALPPGSFAYVAPKGGEPRPTIYWRYNFSTKRRRPMEEAAEELHALLADAIDIRLRADVPVCLTFSGGVDSGLIAAIASQTLDKNLKCWTLDYHSEKEPSREHDLASSVAASLGLNWSYKNFDYYSELLPAIDESLEFVDQPCSHIAISYSHRLYEAIGEEAKVVLTGNGADELFLGYSGNETLAQLDQQRTRLNRMAALAAILPDKLRSRLGLARPPRMSDYQADYLRVAIDTGDFAEEGEVLIENLVTEIEEAGVRTHADLYTWMSMNYYTADPNFRIPDIAGLTSQVELRSPFMDYRVVEFASSLPIGLKTDGTNPAHNKAILKTLYERYVPAEIAYDRKTGMGGNLRYDRLFATDEALLNRYDEQVLSLRDFGIEARRFMEAKNGYIANRKNGTVYSEFAGTMISGLMLARWLNLHRRTARAPIHQTRPV